MSIAENTCKSYNDEANVAQDVWACVILHVNTINICGCGWGFVLDFW